MTNIIANIMYDIRVIHDTSGILTTWTRMGKTVRTEHGTDMSVHIYMFHTFMNTYIHCMYMYINMNRLYVACTYMFMNSYICMYIVHTN